MARSDTLQALLEIAAEQGGYVTSAQASRLGVPGSELPHLTRAGDLRRVRHGVYAMRHARGRLEDEFGAWLSVDRKRLPWERGDEAVAVLSHATAAGLHNLGTIIPQRPEITVPPEHRSATRGTSLELHVAPLDARDWLWLPADDARLPVTTPARTVVDLLLADEEASYVRRAIREALSDQRLSEADLLEAAQRRRRRNERLIDRVETLLEDARK